MSKRLIDNSISNPKWVYLALLIVTFGVGSLIININVDTDPENMLSADEPARVFHNEVKKEFLLKDIIVVGAVAKEFDTIFTKNSLSDLKVLTDEIQKIEGVYQPDLNSLSTIDNIEQAGEGTIRFEWMMATKPENETTAAEIGKKANRLPFVVDTLVSGDQKAATIYVPILDKNESYRISNEIYEIINGLSGSNDYHVTGLPVAEDTFGVEMFIQMGISAPAAAAVIYLLMLFFFRSASLVAAPMIVAMSTVIIIMGAMIGMGFTVHIMSSMIPIFLMPIAVVDSVHLMSEFADLYKPGKNAKKVIAKVTGHLFQPMLFTSVTSAAGFFSLALTPIPPVQVFGIFVGSGILLAFLVTIIFIPAYVSRMSEEALVKMQNKLHKENESGSMLTQALPSWGAFSVRNAKLLVVTSIAVIGISIVGITKIEVNDNPVRWFKSDHKIRVADRVLNEHFAGTYDAHLVFTFSKAKELKSNWEKNLLDKLKETKLSTDVVEQFSNTLKISPEGEKLQNIISLADELSFDLDEKYADVMQQIINEAESVT